MGMSRPELSVVVPAYNEERRLPPSLDRIREYLTARELTYEVLVADDGSRDRTPELVSQRAQGWPQLRLVTLPENRGKGAAVQAGMLAATGRRRPILNRFEASVYSQDITVKFLLVHEHSRKT